VVFGKASELELGPGVSFFVVFGLVELRVLSEYSSVDFLSDYGELVVPTNDLFKRDAV
jgi:hypothetical protein